MGDSVHPRRRRWPALGMGCLTVFLVALNYAAGPDVNYRNVAYGYQLKYPAGWQALDLMGALGTGLDTSADVLFFPNETLRWENVDMGVRICQAVGEVRTDCLPAHSDILIRHDITVAGRTAVRFDLRRVPPSEPPWFEEHILVEHHNRTVQIWASWPPREPWQRQVPELFELMVQSFALD